MHKTLFSSLLFTGSNGIIAKSAPGSGAQCTECRPANHRVTTLIPSLGQELWLQARSPVGGVREATTY